MWAQYKQKNKYYIYYIITRLWHRVSLQDMVTKLANNVGPALLDILLKWCNLHLIILPKQIDMQWTWGFWGPFGSVQINRTCSIKNSLAKTLREIKNKTNMRIQRCSENKLLRGWTWVWVGATNVEHGFLHTGLESQQAARSRKPRAEWKPTLFPLSPNPIFFSCLSRSPFFPCLHVPLPLVWRLFLWGEPQQISDSTSFSLEISAIQSGWRQYVSS